MQSQAIADQITLALGDAQVQIPADQALRALLERLSNQPAPTAAPVSTLAIPVIGRYWPGQGGIYAGMMRGTDGQPDYHLIVGAAENDELAWSDEYVIQEGAQSASDGAANTRALLASDEEHPAAQWAASVTADGFADFYLPARRELSLLYANVPELFKEQWYWSSTQDAGYANYAWCQNFGNGHQNNNDKNNELRARAVRRFKPP